MLDKIKDKRQKAKIAAGILNKQVYTGPWTVQIDLTNKCNNDCIACWCHSKLLGDKAMKPDVKKKFLSYNKTIKLIDELDELGVRDIYFTGGGEPFMHPDIIKVIKHIKKKGIYLDMSTNFTLINKRIADKLIELQVDHMNLSLWAATPKVYSKLHPNKNKRTFQKIIEIIDYINKKKKEKGIEKPHLGMYNVINIHNYHEIDTMLEFTYAHKMQDIQFTPVDTVPERTDHLRLRKKHLKEMVKKIKKMPQQMTTFERKYEHKVAFTGYEDFLRRMSNPDSEDANYDTDILDSLPSCYMGWTFARVLAGGEVNSCLKSFKIPIGNIHEKSFKEIWFGKKQECFRKHTINYNKNDPFFKKIGNDLKSEEQGCYKICDNLKLNSDVHKQIKGLKILEKQLIKMSRFI